MLETPELAAEDLRLAARALERITGRIGAEDVLDVIFVQLLHRQVTFPEGWSWVFHVKHCAVRTAA